VFWIFSGGFGCAGAFGGRARQ